MKLSEIKASNWSLSLTTFGDVVQGLAEISQAIMVIVTTQRGSDPLRPDFGSDIYQYVDRPMNEAIPRMVKSAYDAINIWETRVTLTRVMPIISADGSVEFTIEWTEKTTGATSSTKFLINGTN
jgi:phage baseplate assembly protein W